MTDHANTALEWRRMRRHPLLPRPLPPFPNETIASYFHRLQQANGLPPDRSGANLVIARDEDLATALSALTGRPVPALKSALPELRHHPDAAWQRSEPSGFGDRVWIWVTPEQVVCPRHRRWLGNDDTAGDQLDIAACQDITAANRRHRNLIVLDGRAAVHSAYPTARDICWKWFQQGYRFPSPASRLEVLLGGKRACAFHDPHPTAALYPTVVAFTAILASPRWRRLVLSEVPDDTERFLARVASDVTDGYRPHGGTDPLRYLLTSQAHRPP